MIKVVKYNEWLRFVVLKLKLKFMRKNNRALEIVDYR